MPNIIEQRIGPLGNKAPSQAAGDQIGIYVKASNSREVVITRNQLAARFAAAIGSRDVRRAAVIAWLANQAHSLLGSDMVSESDVTFDFSDDGSPLELGVRRG